MQNILIVLLVIISTFLYFIWSSLTFLNYFHCLILILITIISAPLIYPLMFLHLFYYLILLGFVWASLIFFNLFHFLFFRSFNYVEIKNSKCYKYDCHLSLINILLEVIFLRLNFIKIRLPFNYTLCFINSFYLIANISVYSII